MSIPKHREIRVVWDDGFDIWGTHRALKKELEQAAAQATQAAADRLHQLGWHDHGDLGGTSFRLYLAYTKSIARRLFDARFQPIKDWLEEQGLTLGSTQGKFAGTRQYRLRNCGPRRGFTIQFGLVEDAVHFRLRWGGKPVPHREAA